MLIQITAPHFCAGIDYPHTYAPILAYMRGWLIQRIWEYCAMKGWEMHIINLQ